MQSHYHSSNPLERQLWSRKKKNIREIFDSLEIKSVIDFGCGDGGLIDLINDKIQYTGVDISPKQIEYAKKHLQSLKRKNAEVMQGDILNLKFKDNSFDAALVCDVVEHVLSPEKLFQEIKRVVKKNGYVVFSIPNEYLWETARAILLRFPLRSPDHINAVFPSDIRKEFPSVLKEVHIPISFSSRASLISILVVRNEK